MSDKTETLSFDNALNNHKRLLTESLVNFEEGQRVRKIMLDIDSNSADYEYYFQSGQQSKQADIELLEKEIIETQEFLNNQNRIKQAEIDELQKRIDIALKELELIHFYKTQNSNNAIKILKGEETE